MRDDRVAFAPEPSTIRNLPPYSNRADDLKTFRFRPRTRLARDKAGKTKTCKYEYRFLRFARTTPNARYEKYCDVVGRQSDVKSQSAAKHGPLSCYHKMRSQHRSPLCRAPGKLNLPGSPFIFRVRHGFQRKNLSNHT